MVPIDELLGAAMITTGTVLQKQGEDAERLAFRQTAADTAGSLLEMEATYPPQAAFPPVHIHPEQDEHFTILAGSLTVHIDGSERTYNAGDSFDVPRGAAHTMANMGTTVANFLWETRPALQTAEFHAAIYGVEAAGGRGSIVQLVPILQQHRREFVLARPPVAVQRVLFGGLTLLGRLRKSQDTRSASEQKYSLREQIAIRRPAQDVFAYISDYARDTTWRGSVSAMWQSSPGQATVGTTTRETIRVFGQQIETTGRIVALDPDRSIGFASIDGPIPVHGHRAVEPMDGGTLLTFYLAAAPAGFYRLIAPLMLRDLRQRVRGDLATLKGILER